MKSIDVLVHDARTGEWISLVPHRETLRSSPNLAPAASARALTIECRPHVDSVEAAVCPEIQRQVRCRECNRRLGDYVNEIEAGQVILELKCPKCGRPHAEIIRRWEQDLPPIERRRAHSS